MQSILAAKSFLAAPRSPRTSPPLHVYFAGPDDYKPDRLERVAAKIKRVEEVGCIGHAPIYPSVDSPNNKVTAFKIAYDNKKLMRQCNVLLVDMTPWLGPSMDRIAAFKMGYMSAQADHTGEVLIIGYYTNEFERNFAKRVAQEVYHNVGVTFHENGTATDQNGNSFENFGLVDNLMMETAVNKTGGEIFPTFDEAVANIPRLCSRKRNTLPPKVIKTEESLHVYLAGPDVFKPNPLAIGESKKAQVTTLNEKQQMVCYTGHFPMDHSFPDFGFNPKTAYSIGIANEDLIWSTCQVVLVNLEPWHGPNDVGTVFEGGYADNCDDNDPGSILIIGYFGCETNPNGDWIENYKLQNSAICAAIEGTGGEIYPTFAEAVEMIPTRWAMKQSKREPVEESTAEVKWF